MFETGFIGEDVRQRGIDMKCPECGEYKFGNPGGSSDRWCPKCGTRMRTLPVKRSEDRQCHGGLRFRLGDFEDRNFKIKNRVVR